MVVVVHIAVHIAIPLRIEVGIWKSTYFKINPAILKNKENLLELEVVWKATETIELDPKRHFFVAFEQLRQKCKDLQPNLKPFDNFRSMLQE